MIVIDFANLSNILDMDLEGVEGLKYSFPDDKFYHTSLSVRSINATLNYLRRNYKSLLCSIKRSRFITTPITKGVSIEEHLKYRLCEINIEQSISIYQKSKKIYTDIATSYQAKNHDIYDILMIETADLNDIRNIIRFLKLKAFE